MARPLAGTDDEDLSELPPLDGESGDEGAPTDPLDKNLEVPAEEGGADTEAEQASPPLDPEILVAESEASWLGEEQDAPDLDLGDATLVELGEGASAADDDETGDAGESDLVEPTLDHVGLDAGDEGPVGPDEELRDEDLPALDADDEGEPEEAGFVDARFAADEPLGLAWASRPWERVGAPLGLPAATAIVCAGRCALVALQSARAGTARRSELVQVDLEGSRAVLPTEGFDGSDVETLTNDGTESGAVGLVLRDGGFVASADGGAHFGPELTGFSACGCVFAFGQFWAVTPAGSLVTLDQGAVQPRPVPGAVVAVASGGAAGVVALVTSGDGAPPAIVRFRSDGSFEVAPIGDEGCAAVAGEATLVAARSGYVACAGRAGVSRQDPDGTWRRFGPWEGQVTALTFVDDVGTLVAAAYSDSEDTTGLVRVDAVGNCSVVARVGAVREQGDSDGRALSLACDDARGVVWVAGGFGVEAFSIAAH